MKYLNGTTPMIKDAIVYVTPDGFPVVGYVHTIYERNMSLMFSGYTLQVPSDKCVLAKDAYTSVAKAAADAEAAAKAVEVTPPVLEGDGTNQGS